MLTKEASLLLDRIVPFEDSFAALRMTVLREDLNIITSLHRRYDRSSLKNLQSSKPWNFSLLRRFEIEMTGLNFTHLINQLSTERCTRDRGGTPQGLALWAAGV